MAFTKINAAGIGTTETVTVDGLTVINDGSFGGNLTVSGVLTYEDVTNVDSVGLITARNGIVVGSGITLSKDGDGFFTGVTTATTFVGALTGNVTGNATGLSGTPNISVGTVSGTTGTFTGDVSIADKIIHTGDTNTAIRFPADDTISLETGGQDRLRIASDGLITQKTGDLIIDQTNNGYGGLRIVDSSAGQYSVSYILGRDSGLSAHVFKYAGRTQNASPWSNNGTGNEMGRWSAAGLSFNGDSAAANCLNDYEEGTWTPTLTNTGTNASVNYTVQHGRYTKIGRQVTVHIRCTVNSNSSSNNHIKNLLVSSPFPVIDTLARLEKMVNLLDDRKLESLRTKAKAV